MTNYEKEVKEAWNRWKNEPEEKEEPLKLISVKEVLAEILAEHFSGGVNV